MILPQRKAAEESLQAALTELERSNKELEQFAYVASHDLQEPLRMVASYTQLLAERYEGQLDEKAKKYIDYAVDGAVRMQRLINDLLTYSRVGTRGKPFETADSHALLGEAIRNLAVAIEESRALITNDDLPTVRVDPAQLVQLFQNLLANAIKFRGDGLPAHSCVRPGRGERMGFCVSDNGIGIDRQYADRIFVIFQRLHTRRSIRAPASVWRCASGSWSATAARYGSNPSPGKDRRFSSRCPNREREVDTTMCAALASTH